MYQYSLPTTPKTRHVLLYSERQALARCLLMFRMRKNLARTLLDTQSVVARVGNAMSVLLWLVLLFVFVAIFDVQTFRSTWQALSAGLLAFSFVFGNSIRQVWENMVFLFTVHPFDVGDSIKLDGQFVKVC